MCTKGKYKSTNYIKGGEEEEHKPEDNIHKHQETKVASQSKRA
jgi:hypothetical protein